MLGNPRGNENPFLLTMGVIWFRVHNWFAQELASVNPTWNDEQLFNRARQWTIATHQANDKENIFLIDLIVFIRKLLCMSGCHNFFPTSRNISCRPIRTSAPFIPE